MGVGMSIWLIKTAPGLGKQHSYGRQSCQVWLSSSDAVSVLSVKPPKLEQDKLGGVVTRCHLSVRSLAGVPGARM